MKLMLKIIIAIVTISSIGVGSWLVYNKLATKKRAISQLKLFPNLQLTSLDSLPVFTSDLVEPNKSIIVCLFNSECDHCNQQLTEIKEIVSSNDLNVILISSESLFHIKRYIQANNLQNPKIHFASIDQGKVFETFGAISFPHLLIYNTKGELRKEFMGEVKAEAILNYINK